MAELLADIKTEPEHTRVNRAYFPLLGKAGSF